jgi:excinuclease ABC subunit B
LDADKQGFLRSKTSLIQTMGRASRNISGQVILYADEISYAMKEAIKEVERRRKFQLGYNRSHGIIPRSIEKPIREKIAQTTGKKGKKAKFGEIDIEGLTPGEARKLIPQMRREMRQAAAELDFEKAAQIRDLIEKLLTV